MTGGPDVDRTENGTASDDGANNPVNEGEYQAFDNNNNSKWLMFNPTGNIVYDFSGEDNYAINRYTVTSANDANDRDPKNWNLQGSNDGANWTTVNSQSEQYFGNRFETKTYNISNTTGYKQYRLNITANNGGGLLQIGEIQMFGPAGSGGGGCTSPTPTLSANPASGVPTTLTASGCSGTVTWGDNTTGTTKYVTSAGTYTATCTAPPCTVSGQASITVTGPGGGNCRVNKVRLIFRKWNIFPCCTERLIGAKILGQNNDNSWSELYTFNSNATNEWEPHYFTGGTFKAVKFQSGPNSSGEVDELEFYDGDTKLTGTAFGTGNFYNNVFDGIEDNGSIGTQWSGSSNGPQNYVGLNLNGCGGTASRIAAASEVENEFDTNDFGTNPNPSSGGVMVSFKGEKGTMGSLVVHDMTGKTLITDSIEANVGKLIELPNHFVGMSLFTLTTDTFIKTKKVIIVK